MLVPIIQLIVVNSIQTYKNKNKNKKNVHIWNEYYANLFFCEIWWKKFEVADDDDEKTCGQYTQKQFSGPASTVSGMMRKQIYIKKPTVLNTLVTMTIV